jgi:hypothetical protein
MTANSKKGRKIAGFFDFGEKKIEKADNKTRRSQFMLENSVQK